MAITADIPISSSSSPVLSYQVLARKWRPKNFETLVGQEHVVRALTHALDQQRLHHAWLFTGTRGVGKTTLSRILAKSLNCVGPDGNGGITSRPCGVCQACTEIDAGRFVDYIEMDAASNRGVDEMAQLLEQAVYAPSNARFKVYMIDEVHMLTNHAFNSMLKTLEEPPDHVKFILATTDPQKIPVTVLSRCLQFNLKQMPPPQIVGHLEHILQQENIACEPQALRLLAQAAQGSMRDALSLTDQAIAYSAGTVTEAAVRGMLGALDQTYLIRILDALSAGKGVELLAVADEIAARSLSYGAALQDLASLLHRIALAQSIPDALNDTDPEAAHVRRLAGVFNAEEVQLHYQIALLGRSELGLAPDEYAGFTMTLLRMLAFRPSEQERSLGMSPAHASEAAPKRLAGHSAGASPARSPAAEALLAVRQGNRANSNVAVVRAPVLNEPAPAAFAQKTDAADHSIRVAPRILAGQSSSLSEAGDSQTASSEGMLDFDGDWLALAAKLKVTGMTRQMMEQAELIGLNGSTFMLRVPSQGLLSAGTADKLKVALAGHFGRPVQISVQVGALQGTTVAAVEQGERAARQASAEATIEADPFVQALVKDFGASIVPGSIKPL